MFKKSKKLVAAQCNPSAVPDAAGSSEQNGGSHHHHRRCCCCCCRCCRPPFPQGAEEAPVVPAVPGIPAGEQAAPTESGISHHHHHHRRCCCCCCCCPCPPPPPPPTDGDTAEQSGSGEEGRRTVLTDIQSAPDTPEPSEGARIESFISASADNSAVFLFKDQIAELGNKLTYTKSLVNGENIVLAENLQDIELKGGFSYLVAAHFIGSVFDTEYISVVPTVINDGNEISGYSEFAANSPNGKDSEKETLENANTTFLVPVASAATLSFAFAGSENSKKLTGNIYIVAVKVL